MSWDRVQRTMRDMEDRLDSAQTEEQCIAIGALARDLLVSLGQAVYDRETHRTKDAEGTEIGNADARRMLNAYIDSTLTGEANAEFRAQVKTTVTVANTLTHKRTATPLHARLCVVATENLIRIVEVVAGRRRDDEEWVGVEVDGRYFVWDGPRLHALEDRRPVPAPRSAEDAVRRVGMIPSYGEYSRLRGHLAKGRLQVFETDRRHTWRKELVYAADGRQVLLVRPARPGEG